ncbi:hypothetical protein KM043_017247 [Ampulex compressa]|nr:hypothetical protein KM043_017247 [Ampulex compressa]
MPRQNVGPRPVVAFETARQFGMTGTRVLLFVQIRGHPPQTRRGRERKRKDGVDRGERQADRYEIEEDGEKSTLERNIWMDSSTPFAYVCQDPRDNAHIGVAVEYKKSRWKLAPVRLAQGNIREKATILPSGTSKNRFFDASRNFAKTKGNKAHIGVAVESKMSRSHLAPVRLA